MLVELVEFDVIEQTMFLHQQILSLVTIRDE
jgi:hypothetical protein